MNSPIAQSDGEPSFRWKSSSNSLTFKFGGFLLGRVHFSIRILDVPFHQLSSRDSVRPDWDSWEPDLSVAAVFGQPIESELKRLSYADRCIRYVLNHEDRYWVDLAGTFSDYLKKFSSKTRNTLKRKMRKAAELSGGRIHWQEYRAAAEILEFHRMACAISAKTYQTRLGLGLPDDESFRRQMIPLAECDQVRGYLIFHQNRAVAFAYCPAQDDNLVYRWPGYDPQERQWSPGSVLTYLILERLFEERRFRTLDFGQQDFDYKGFFATHHLRCANVLLFRPTLRNILLVGCHQSLFLLESATLYLLELLRLKAWLKRILRVAT
jgi:hypothetical protein